MSTLKVNTIQSFVANDPVTVNDSLQIIGSSGVSGSLSVSGSILPLTDDQHDLGSSTKQWKDLYIDGTANIDILKSSVSNLGVISGSSLVPNTTNTLNLGASLTQWKDLYIDGVAYIDLGEFDFIKVGPLGVSSSLQPTSGHGQFDLGTVSSRWRSASLSYVSVAGDVSSSGLEVHGAKVDFTQLPTSDPSVSGRLFQQSGSQLFGGQVTGSVSGSVFVVVSQG